MFTTNEVNELLEYVANPTHTQYTPVPLNAANQAIADRYIKARNKPYEIVGQYQEKYQMTIELRDIKGRKVTIKGK